MELIGFKEYYGMPRVHKHDPIYSSVFTRAFRANCSLSFPRKTFVMGKKDRCAVIRLNDDRLFPENIQ